jgi:hypothetical protein
MSEACNAVDGGNREQDYRDACMTSRSDISRFEQGCRIEHEHEHELPPVGSSRRRDRMLARVESSHMRSLQFRASGPKRP